MTRALTKREFIAKAIKVHGNKYNYSKVYYENNYTKVAIICPSHGEFWQRPGVHLLGQGCSICSGRSQKTTAQFIREAIQTHVQV